MEVTRIAAFEAAFEAEVRQTLDQDDLIPKLNYDGVLMLSEIDLGVLAEIERMAPFGIGNPEPLLLVEGANVAVDKHAEIDVFQNVVARVRNEVLDADKIIEARRCPLVALLSDRDMERIVLGVDLLARAVIVGVLAGEHQSRNSGTPRRQFLKSLARLASATYWKAQYNDSMIAFA